MHLKRRFFHRRAVFDENFQIFFESERNKPIVFVFRSAIELPRRYFSAAIERFVTARGFRRNGIRGGGFSKTVDRGFKNENFADEPVFAYV